MHTLWALTVVNTRNRNWSLPPRSGNGDSVPPEILNHGYKDDLHCELLTGTLVNLEIRFVCHAFTLLQFWSSALSSLPLEGLVSLCQLGVIWGAILLETETEWSFSAKGDDASWQHCLFSQESKNLDAFNPIFPGLIDKKQWSPSKLSHGEQTLSLPLSLSHTHTHTQTHTHAKYIYRWLIYLIAILGQCPSIKPILGSSTVESFEC